MSKGPSDIKIQITTGAKGTALSAGGRTRVVVASFTVNPTRSMGEPHKGQEGFLEPLVLNHPQKAKASTGRDGLGQYRRKTFAAEGDIVSGSLNLDAYADPGVVAASVTASAGTQRFWWKGFKFGLSGEGTAVARLELPGFDRGLAFYMWEEYWCHPAFPAKLSDIPQLSRMLLWREKDGLFGCLMPLIGGDAVTYLKGVPGAVEVRVSTFNEGQVSAQGPAFLVVFGRDPYALVEKATQSALKHLGYPARTREKKKYPKSLEYLGWCTWDAFYRKVNASGMEKQLAFLKKKKFPLGFVIVDDGWYQMTDNMMVDLQDDRVKFPKGIAASVRSMKKRYGVPYVGFWHSLTGYWYGIHPKNNLAPALKKDLVFNKAWPPAPPTEGEPARRFWETWHGWMKRQGADFVKVDGQGNVPRYLKNRVPVAPSSEHVQRALQGSVRKHFRGDIINCMSMGPEQTWFYDESNVTRSSNDYMWQGKEFDLGNHARVNAYNSLWLSQISWCDWDMFWSASDNADYHAALRALSGGPVYISDRVGKVRPEKLWPLILKDGRLLRCDGVGLPTADGLMANPADGKSALKIMNTANGSGLIGLFHAANVKTPIRSAFRPSEIRGLDGDFFAVWDRRGQKGTLLRRQEYHSVTLKPKGFEVFVVQPIRSGFAPIGLVDKIVSPKTILNRKADGNGASMQLVEGGRLMAYSVKPPRRVSCGKTVLGFQWVDGWLEIMVPDVSKPMVKIDY